MSEPVQDQFFTLTPDRVLGAVERALGSDRTGIRATGRTLTLNSMENRVYEIELDDSSRVVTKFYRPGRWTRDTILEEHAFIAELVAAEVPAVAPLPLVNGSTLDASEDGIFFAVFPKTRGRIVQEIDDARLQQIGRLLGRLHNVGASRAARNRITLDARTYGREPLKTLEASGLVDPAFLSRYRDSALRIIEAVEPRLARARSIRTHGDCHLGNVLWNESGPFFLDFDDMVAAPAVQDVWLIVRGRDAEASRARDVLLASYEQMRAFDRAELGLIEALRALRIIHYSAWIARRWEDPTFKRAFPDFNGTKYWVEEIQTLEEQYELIIGGSGVSDGYGNSDSNGNC